MGKKLAIISGVLILIFVLMYLFMPVIAVLGESLLVQLDIQNPHVGNHFLGWSQVQVDDVRPFLIPKGWTLEEDSGVYKIVDESGEVWAYGAVLGSDETHFHNYKELVAMVYSDPFVEIELQSFERFVMMNGSDVDLLRVRGNLSDIELFCIQLFENAQEELVWILMPDLSLDEEQYDIAEALVYSYAFGVSK